MILVILKVYAYLLLWKKINHKSLYKQRLFKDTIGIIECNDLRNESIN